jgi:hypothetical protein
VKFCSEDLSGGEHNIETGWGRVDWVYLAKYRDQLWGLVSTVMNLRVRHKARNFLASLSTISS